MNRKPLEVKYFNTYQFADGLLEVGRLYKNVDMGEDKLNRLPHRICVLTSIMEQSKKLSRGTITTEYVVAYQIIGAQEEIVSTMSAFIRRYSPLTETELERFTNVNSASISGNSN